MITGHRRLLDRLASPFPRTLAVVIAVVVAVGSGWIAAGDHSVVQSDIDQLWFAARAVLDGRDPNALIGPGKEFDFAWPLNYPLPAALSFVPLAPFPVELTRIAMAALPGGGLAYLIARTDPRGLVLFLSKAYYLNAWYGQWSPLLMCALYVPDRILFRGEAHHRGRYARRFPRLARGQDRGMRCPFARGIELPAATRVALALAHRSREQRSFSIHSATFERLWTGDYCDVVSVIKW